MRTLTQAQNLTNAWTHLSRIPLRCYSSITGEVWTNYKSKVDSKELDQDDYQEKVAQALQSLSNNITKYSPAVEGSFLSQLFTSKSSQEKSKNNVPKGLYLYGSVGCGKTMLMDLFFEHCSVIPNKKRRVHFHSFMLDVHQRIHDQKDKQVTTRSSRKALRYNPISPVAKDLVSESWLLCLDEFQVTDVGDAMILKQLFAELFASGSIVVATSNRAPDDLYKNGLQRSAFLPFIPLLKKHCNVLALDSGIDYRQKSLPSKQKIYLLTHENADEELDRLFKIFASRETDTIRPKTITVKGRNVTFKKTCGQVADCTFDELCERALGAVDYLAMSQLFHTVIIRNIPRLTATKKSPARRFITLVDTLYDHKVRLLFSADVPARELFAPKTTNEEMDDDDRKLMDDLGIKLGSNDSNSSIFSGEEELFAFDRTVSRISEMQTQEYWDRREVYI